MNTNLPVLEDFKRVFGGVVAVHSTGDDRSRLSWEWRCYGDTAAEALVALLPLLREKGPQAYLGLHYRTLGPGTAAREHTKAALSLLKKTTHYRSNA